MLRNQSSFSDWAATYVLEPFGSGKYSLPLLAGFTAWGYYSGDSRYKMAGLEGFVALAASGVVTQFPKTLAHRRRPYMGQDPFVFLGPKSNGTVSLSLKSVLNGSYFGGDYRSYWSGHTAAAFATATSIALNFKDKPWVGCVAYGMAGMVGVSRMYQNKHWASDVVFGALCGWGCAQVVHRRKELFRYIPGVKPKDYLTY